MVEFISQNWKWLLPLILLLLFLLYLLLRNLTKEDDESWPYGAGSNSGSNNGNFDPGPSKQQIASNAAQIKEILAGDPVVAELFAKQYSQQASQLVGNEPRILQIAAQIVPYDLEMYKLASKQDLIKFNVQAKTQLERSMFPADEIAIEPITEYEDIMYGLPEQRLLPSHEFTRQLVGEELLGVKFYEKKTLAKILYILKDCSGSMEEALASGVPKHVWARGVIVNLLINAQKEGGKFFLRDFNDKALDLKVVETNEQMQSMAENLLRYTNAGGGTNIRNAISTAVDDIRSKGGDFAHAELLVITDGQDNDMDVHWLKQCLGNDIALHFVGLGARGQAGGNALQSVAKTFAEYN